MAYAPVWNPTVWCLLIYKKDMKTWLAEGDGSKTITHLRAQRTFCEH